jgi:hypothetical protein
MPDDVYASESVGASQHRHPHLGAEMALAKTTSVSRLARDSWATLCACRTITRCRAVCSRSQPGSSPMSVG